MGLENKVVLITGAARGIGAETARRAAAKGARVSLVGLEPERLRALADELGERAAWFEADVTDQEQVDGAVAGTVAAFGGIDVVVNNAANALALPLGEYTPEAWAKSLDVNLRGPVFLVQEALPALKRSEHAAVLNVVSGAAFLFSSTVSLYAICKAGLVAATKSMAAEFVAHRIRVNALSPGTVDTDMVRNNPPEAQERMAQAAWMRRAADPDEMVGPALFLASDAASFVTGEIIAVDGGFLASGVNQ